MSPMARKGSACGICENTNVPSACAACINSRLTEKYKSLRMLSRRRDHLFNQVHGRLKAKLEADQQCQWSLTHRDNVSKLKQRLHELESELKKGKEELVVKQHILDSQSQFFAAASAQLAKREVEQLSQHESDVDRTHHVQHMEIISEIHQRRKYIFRQLCKIFPLKYMASASGDNRETRIQSWSICDVHLPVGDDPHSVGEQDLAASLGYMLQLLHLVTHYLSAPSLHIAQIRGSTSKVWQRSSYWDSSSFAGYEYPLFISKSASSLSEEQAFLEKGNSIMGFSTIEGTSDSKLNISGSSKYGSSSMQNIEMHNEVRKGIKLLKRSIACVSSYGYSLLLLSMPSNMSTIQSLSELLFILSSKEIRPRSNRNAPRHMNTLAESLLSIASSMEERSSRVAMGGNMNLANSFYYVPREFGGVEGRFGEMLDGWDMVEHPTLPPPPSDSEDVEHWTRAMFLDAKK